MTVDKNATPLESVTQNS